LPEGERPLERRDGLSELLQVECGVADVHVEGGLHLGVAEVAEVAEALLGVAERLPRASPPEAVGGEPVVAEGEPALLAVLPPLLTPLEQERLGLGEPPLQRAEHAEVLERDGLPAEVAHLALEPERLLAQRPGLLGLPQLD